MSPGAGADWATTPAPGFSFDDIVVFQPVSAVFVIMTSIVVSFFLSFKVLLLLQIVFNLSNIYMVFLSMGNKAQFLPDIQIMQ
jgi:hypothetical protein